MEGNALKNPFRLDITPYWIYLPEHAHVEAVISKPKDHEYRVAWTHWVITVERFRLSVHLSARDALVDLKRHIERQTRKTAITRDVVVNGIQGVTHGDYGPPRTWIDWWFKKGDVPLCLNLQSVVFPVTAPTPAELAEHQAIIESIQYGPDSPGGKLLIPQRIRRHA